MTMVPKKVYAQRFKVREEEAMSHNEVFHLILDDLIERLGNHGGGIGIWIGTVRGATQNGLVPAAFLATSRAGALA